MPTISRAYHAHGGNYTPGGNSCRYIVVHNTGNTAGANAEARYAATNQHPSSYHYVLDGGGTVYQILDDTDTAWAVGAWRGARQLIGNGESVSIEVCSNGVAFTGAEVDELHWLVRLLMERHGIPASRVVRHYDCHTGHKDCPAYYVNESRWASLHATITAPYEEDKELPMEFTYQAKNGKSQKWYDGQSIHPFATPAEKNAVESAYKAATGERMPFIVMSDADAKAFEAAVKRTE